MMKIYLFDTVTWKIHREKRMTQRMTSSKILNLTQLKDEITSKDNKLLS